MGRAAISSIRIPTSTGSSTAGFPPGPDRIPGCPVRWDRRTADRSSRTGRGWFPRRGCSPGRSAGRSRSRGPRQGPSRSPGTARFPPSRQGRNCRRPDIGLRDRPGKETPSVPSRGKYHRKLRAIHRRIPAVDAGGRIGDTSFGPLHGEERERFVPCRSGVRPPRARRGGTEKHVLDLASRIDARRFAPCVISTAEDATLSEEFAARGIPVYLLPYKGLSLHPSRFFPLLRDAVRFFRDFARSSRSGASPSCMPIFPPRASSARRPRSGAARRSGSSASGRCAGSRRDTPSFPGSRTSRTSPRTP